MKPRTPRQQDQWARARAMGSAQVPRGEGHHSARLTASQVVSIRVAHRNRQKRKKELAFDYGVSSRCISDIINRKTWRHVP